MLALWKESYDRPRQHIKKQRHYFALKGLYAQRDGFLVVVYECEIWTKSRLIAKKTDAFKLWC